MGVPIEARSILASALIKQVNGNDYANAEVGRHGTKYIVEAPIESPKGATTPVKTIWMIAEGTKNPRLITAYPV